jgi:hypothetical protein
MVNIITATGVDDEKKMNAGALNHLPNCIKTTVHLDLNSHLLVYFPMIFISEIATAWRILYKLHESVQLFFTKQAL